MEKTILDKLKEICLQDLDVTKNVFDNPNHCIDFNNRTVLATANKWRKLFIKESILI